MGIGTFSSIGTGITYSVEKRIWVAVGNGGIGVSINGLTWGLITSPLQNSGTTSFGSWPTYSGVATKYCLNTTIT
jgi:hypothetical protein